MSDKIYIVGIVLIVAMFGYFMWGQPGETKPAAATETKLAEVVNGKQVIKMTAEAGGYSPNYFKLKAGVPVVWEITATDNAGCANALVAPGFIKGTIWLTAGGTVTQEFTPTTPGRYRFSCSMGMYTGTFEVVN